MKKYRLLIILITMSYFSFSQGLKPIVQRSSEDTLFCFTRSQSRYIARSLEELSHCALMYSSLTQENHQLYQIIGYKDQIIQAQNKQKANQTAINQNLKVQLDHYQKIIQTQKRKIRFGKMQKMVLGLGLSLAGWVAIIK